jgi:hypothetical protein
MQIAKKFLHKPQWILLKELNSKETKTSTNSESINCNNSTANNAQKKEKERKSDESISVAKIIDYGDLIAFTIE